MCVFLYLKHTEYQNTHSASKVRRFLDHEDILASPHNLKGLLDLVGWGENCVKVRVRVRVRVTGLVGMVRVRVRDWVIHYLYDSNYEDRSSARLLLYVSVYVLE